MAQGARQSSLFAAEDFSVVYESFAQADFQAYDYDTIKNSMVNYINNNYPENFNDWITSSEFVSLIELMAFLGHNLAFRADLTSRENYLSTAERRESVLRIADFLGYAPSRNTVATGYLKIDTIKTNEPVFDVEGNSLANVNIQFEDITNPNTYQNFLTVMNSVLQENNLFGTPFAKFNKNNIQNEIYRTNSTSNNVVFDFSGNVLGGRANFNVHSVYYNQTLDRLEEKEPDPNGVLDILYRDDNGGFSSPNTGFFVGFKQGNLSFRDFNVTSGLPNLVLDINEPNVANNNVWVQTIDEFGRVSKSWTQIDKLFGNSAIYNNLSAGIRDVYTVTSRENDQVSVVFGDGAFGNIPRGIIRVWYRTGLNLTYSISPDTFGRVVLNFTYVSRDGNNYTATFNCSLKSTVSNASARESIDSIKANASRFFATQDRMVTAEDYSIFPITVSENIRKIKSINRVHSGHSRFRDMHDPTGTYSDAIMYADDAYIYKEDVTDRSTVALPVSLNSEAFYQRYIRHLLNHPEIKNFYYQRHFYGSATGSYNPSLQFSDTTSSINYYNTSGSEVGVYRWNQVTVGNNNCTGYITLDSIIQRMGDTGSYPLRKLEPNGLVEFITSPFKTGYIRNIEIINGGSGYTSAPTVTVSGAGSGAVLVANISSGSVTSITVLDSGENYTEATNVSITGGGGSGAIARAQVSNSDTMWARIIKLENTGLGEDDATGTPTGVDATGRGAVVINAVIPSGARIKRIVPSWETELIDSVKTEVLSKISNKNSFALRYDPDPQQWKVIDSSNLSSNNVTSNSPTSWSRLYEGDLTDTGRDNSWLIRVNYSSSEWEILTRKTRFVVGSEEKIKFNNLNFAETFSSESLKPHKDSIEFLSINTKSSLDRTPLLKTYKFNTFGYFVYTDGYTDPYKIRVVLADPDNDGFPNDPTAFENIASTETIRLGTVTRNGFEYNLLNANGNEIKSGRSGMHIKYNRIADLNQVIDPSTTNIIDTFVLLSSYERNFRTWAQYDGRPFTKPNPPTISELTDMFNIIENKKSVSDQVIYRPVKFKILFGDLANSELQARFNVTKTSNATMSSTEIKQEVIRLINEYFDVNNWDFGETFYFSEMAAFIHNNMIGQISQITASPVVSQNPSTIQEIIADSDELFIPILSTSNITITDNFIPNPTALAANTGVNFR